MFTNPSNPSQHGIVPLNAIQRIIGLESIYLSHPKRKYPGLTSIYDFSESGTSKSVFLSTTAPSNILAYFLGSDFATIAGQIEDPNVFWTLLEIHDWPRFLQYNPFEGGRAYLALGYLLSVQGMPIIYYGLEQGFNGNCDMSKIKVSKGAGAIQAACNSEGDGRKRQDMFMSGPYRLESAIPEINNLAQIGPFSQTPYAWNADPMLARDHYLYQLVRKMIQTRNSCGTLSWGKTNFRNAGSNNDDFIAFSRLDSSREMVVMINPKKGGIQIDSVQIDNTINYNMVGQKYINLFDNTKVGYIGYNGAQAYIYLNNTSGANQLGPQSINIYIHQKFVGSFNTVTQSYMCAPYPTPL